MDKGFRQFNVQRLEGGSPSTLPYSPPRQTLSDPARPAVQPGKDFQQDMIAGVVNDGLFGPTAQANYAMLLDYALRPPGELFDGRTSAATASEVIADRFPGRPEGSLANLGTELAFGALEPGLGELSKLAGAVIGFRPSIVRNLFTGGVAQSIESADTSLSQVPGLFTWMRRTGVGIAPGNVNLDIGGGRFDKATDFVREELGGTNFVFDPFNRSVEHNARVIDEIVSRGGADTVTVANVLNVIPEQDNQVRVIEQALEGLRPGGTAYFSVYTGDRSGIGRATSKGFQQNRATADYVPLIESIFGADNVRRQGDIIIATRPSN